MQKLFIVGNLTRDPELRSTPDGAYVCDFTVAVNRRGKDQDADFFRVSAWRGLAENCHKYLAKGRKVAVTGSVRMRLYTSSDGQTRGSMEVNADDVEFLSPKNMVEMATEVMSAAPPTPPPRQVGFTEVQIPDEELPF